MKRETPTISESERWLSALVGGMLALSSLRRRDVAAGAVFALGGAALIFRGIAGRDGFFDAVRDAVGAAVRGDGGGRGGGRGGGGGGGDGGRRTTMTEPLDDVEEASMESFPASDPPSWTPTGGAEVEPRGDEG